MGEKPPLDIFYTPIPHYSNHKPTRPKPPTFYRFTSTSPFSHLSISLSPPLRTMPNEEEFNESMSLRNHRHPTPAVLSPAAKPKGGARLLSILLRLIVMHIVLTFFFLFAGIAVFVLIFLCCTGKVLRHRRRRRLFQHPAIERRGLSREEIRRLPCFRYSESGSDDCVVCLEGLREGDWCRVLPGCKHSFHRICVDRWLDRSKSCPICRAGVASGWI